MKSKERKDKHKKELRESILEKAAELFAKDGVQGVTIRKIAEAIDYAPPIVYEFFKNKEAVLLALKEEWSDKLFFTIQAIFNEGMPAAEALEKIVMQYYDFSQENGEFFKALMGLSVFSCNQSSSIQMIRLILKELIENSLNKRSAVDLDDAVDMIRGFLDGICLLSLTKRLRGEQIRTKELLKKGLDAYLKAWQM